MSFFDIFKKSKSKSVDFIPQKLIAEPKFQEEISALNTPNNYNYSCDFNGSKFPGALPTSFWDEDNIDIEQLRTHSKKLDQRNTIANAALKKKNNTVINSGLAIEAKPVKRILKQDGRVVPDDWDKITEARFRAWSRSKGADYSFKRNFNQLQSLVYNNFLLNGEAVIIQRLQEDIKRSRIGRLNLQVIDINRVKTPSQEELEKVKKKGGDIIDGKEIDETGTVIAYYIFKNKRNINFLDDINKEQWIRVPRWAEKTNRLNVIHLFMNNNPDAVTGIPYLTSVIHDLAKLDQYRIAEIQAALVNAQIALIQNSDGAQPNFDMIKQGVRKQTSNIENSDGTTSTATTVQTLAPGEHVYATRAGQKLESFNTSRPNVNFDAFVESVSTHIAAALGIPIEIVFMKFSNNYSASRAALLEFWRFVISDRFNFAWDFCNPVYYTWLNDEIIQGRISASGWFSQDKTQQIINQSAWSNAEWHGIAKGSIDPLKEIKAAELAENRSLITAEKNARELFGTDFDLNVEKRKKEAPEQRKTIVTEGQTEGNNNGDTEQ